MPTLVAKMMLVIEWKIAKMATTRLADLPSKQKHDVFFIFFTFISSSPLSSIIIVVGVDGEGKNK